MNEERNSPPKLYLQPGDRVRLTQDVYRLSLESVNQFVLTGTKGSKGIVLSLEEYYDEYELRLKKYRIRRNMDDLADYFSGVKETIDNCSRYPIKLENVLPLSNSDDQDMVENLEGSVALFFARELEKIA